MEHQTPYCYALAEDEYEGTINGIKIRWQRSAVEKVNSEVARTEQPFSLLKSLTEHFIYLAAHRLGHKSAKILAPPHRFSVDSRTGQVGEEEYEHVSAELSGGSISRGKVHVYLSGETWDQQCAIGEGFIPNKELILDPKYSQGWYPQLLSSATSSTSTKGQSAKAGKSATSGSSNFSDWVLSEDGVTYGRQNYSTGEWEYYDEAATSSTGAGTTAQSGKSGQSGKSSKPSKSSKSSRPGKSSKPGNSSSGGSSNFSDWVLSEDGVTYGRQNYSTGEWEYYNGS